MAAAISSLHEDSREAALARLQEVTDLEAETCLATEAVLDDDPVPCRTNLRVRFAVPDLAAVMTRYNPWNPVEAVMTASGAPSDQRPCQLCEDAQHQEDMILCDRCNDCYHRDCARSSGGSRVHDGPWFCSRCHGHITLYGATDVTHDWPLIDHLWTGWLPADPEEAQRIQDIARHYRAHET